MSKSKRIVVDASVARSAGWGSKSDSLSRRCRESLEVVLTVRHRIVFSDECLAEWKKHMSGFTRGWLKRMHARKGVVLLKRAQDQSLRNRLIQAVPDETSQAAILKDAHLVEAACQTDRIVISRDEIVRDLFRRACPQIQEIQAVCWANPDIEDERVADWLTSGAKNEVARRLGA